MSKATISRRVSAGLIPRLPGHERALIPADYIKRLTTTYPVGK